MLPFGAGELPQNRVRGEIFQSRVLDQPVERRSGEHFPVKLDEHLSHVLTPLLKSSTIYTRNYFVRWPTFGNMPIPLRG